MVTDNVDGFFIARHVQQEILTLLREAADLLMDLTAVIAREPYPRISFEARVSMGEKEQPLPINVDAQEAHDELYNELTGWIRHVCEYRGMAVYGAQTIYAAARWLDRNIIALALTEGSEEALGSIGAAVRKARRAAKVSAPQAYAGSVSQARDAELNAAAIERMRCELGIEYAGLTARRIKTLRNRTPLEPIRVVASPDGDLAVYRLGDVLDAHLAYPARRRKVDA